MTTWNYRLIKHDEEEPENIYYGLHEVYYNEDGTIWSWTDEAFLVSDTPEEMIEILEMIKNDIDLERRKILVYSEIS